MALVVLHPPNPGGLLLCAQPRPGRAQWVGERTLLTNRRTTVLHIIQGFSVGFMRAKNQKWGKERAVPLYFTPQGVY